MKFHSNSARRKCFRQLCPDIYTQRGAKSVLQGMFSGTRRWKSRLSDGCSVIKIPEINSYFAHCGRRCAKRLSDFDVSRSKNGCVENATPNSGCRKSNRQKFHSGSACRKVAWRSSFSIPACKIVVVRSSFPNPGCKIAVECSSFTNIGCKIAVVRSSLPDLGCKTGVVRLSFSSSACRIVVESYVALISCVQNLYGISCCNVKFWQHNCPKSSSLPSMFLILIAVWGIGSATVRPTKLN